MTLGPSRPLSKAFYSGVSVDQIMHACHWKARNTFTNFYLKDLTWSDNDNNMYLCPVVLDSSSQTSHPRKEKKGGGGGGGGGQAHPLQLSPQESNPTSRYRLPHQGVSGKVFIYSYICIFCIYYILY